MPNDGEEAVRVQFAVIIAEIAVAAQRLLVAQQLQGQRAARPGETPPLPVCLLFANLSTNFL